MAIYGNTKINSKVFKNVRKFIKIYRNFTGDLWQPKILISNFQKISEVYFILILFFSLYFIYFMEIFGNER